MGSFDIRPAKVAMRAAIEKHNLWKSIAGQLGRDVRTVRRWFSDGYNGMTVECLLLCASFDELKPSLRAGLRALDDSLGLPHSIERMSYFLQYHYQFKSAGQSGSRTMQLLDEICQTYRQMPDLFFWLKESADTGAATIDLKIPFEPVLIEPIELDVLGLKYMAPLDVLEPSSGLNYNELCQQIFQKIHGRPISDWAKELRQHCRLGTTVKSRLVDRGRLPFVGQNDLN